MADARFDKELTVNEAMGTQAMTARFFPAGRSVARLALALAATFAAVLLWTAPAHAWEGIELFEMTPSETQAGGHPDVTIKMKWENSVVHEGVQGGPSNPCNCDDPKYIEQHFPTGFIGNPHATAICEIVEFSFGRCPPGSQVGTVEPLFGFAPLFNVQPHPSEPSLTAFWVPLVKAPVFISLSGRTESDYGLDAKSSPVYHPLPIPALNVTLWGVPADEKHFGERFTSPLKGFGTCFSIPTCVASGETGVSANEPPVPYLEAPTTCGVPLVGSATLQYYTHGIVQADDSWPTTTGCQNLTFNPSLTAEPTTKQADSPAGVNIDLKVPQEQNPTTPSPSEIKETTTTLPEGFAINSSAADGKATCSDADTKIGTRERATCSEFSKVGSLSLDSSALPEPIPGWIYLLDPKPGDTYRILLAASGFGTNFKIAGSVFPDARTGQLVVKFKDLPQSPLTEFNMHFFGSERGLLATPTQCGSYPVESEFVPWDAALLNQTTVSNFTVDTGAGGQPCPNGPRPFAPQFSGGTSNTTAGMRSPLTLEFTRGDGQQNLSTLGVDAPPGLLASLRGVTYCPEAAIAAARSASHSGLAEMVSPTCPASSQVGTVTAGAGAGSHQVFLLGRAFLAGPYRGSPLSLVVVTPAVSGPYDVGNAVVRAAINVNPVTTQVSAASDPLPQILGGIPLRLRSIRIDLNRPGFTLNPTNCDPFALGSTVGGSEGALVSLRTGFQVANCASLPYKPSLSLKLNGGVNRRGHPAIHALLKTARDEANSKTLSVTLPAGEQVDNAHLNTICTRVQFAAGNCPDGSLVGEAEATTPLLDQPLKGKVYLRSSSHELPDLAMKLSGQIDIELSGQIDTTKGGALRTTFGAPDAPVSTFALDLLGGKRGIVVNGESLCGTSKLASVKMIGQNNAVDKTTAKLQAACSKRAKKPKRQHARKAVH
jgi:hypothetical protein